MYLPDVIDMEKYTDNSKDQVKSIAKVCVKVVNALTNTEIKTLRTGFDAYLYDTLTIIEELAKEKAKKVLDKSKPVEKAE